MFVNDVLECLEKLELKMPAIAEISTKTNILIILLTSDTCGSEY